MQAFVDVRINLITSCKLCAREKLRCLLQHHRQLVASKHVKFLAQCNLASHQPWGPCELEGVGYHLACFDGEVNVVRRVLSVGLLEQVWLHAVDDS